MAIAYWTVASITLTLVIKAFLKDRDAKKRDLTALLFIASTALFWPITLPFIMRTKLQATKARQQAKRRLQVQNAIATMTQINEVSAPGLPGFQSAQATLD